MIRLAAVCDTVPGSASPPCACVAPHVANRMRSLSSEPRDPRESRTDPAWCRHGRIQGVPGTIPTPPTQIQVSPNGLDQIPAPLLRACLGLMIPPFLMHPKRTCAGSRSRKVRSGERQNRRKERGQEEERHDKRQKQDIK